MSDNAKRIALGDVVTLEIEEINNLGAGVAKLDGLVVFVKGGVSGDTVRAKIIKLNKSFAVARLEEVISPSPYREDDSSACHEPNACGGCVWRGVRYAHELEMKKKYVESVFVKAGLGDTHVLDVATTDKLYRYRNKAQYPVCKTKTGIRAGFYASKTHNIIPISDCLIQNERFAPIVQTVCEFAEEKNISVYDEKTGKGLLRHIYLRSADKGGEIMLCLVINGTSLPHSDELVRRIKASAPEVSGVLLNVNTKNTNVVLGEKFILLDGKDYIEDVLCGLRFKIAPEAFYQVNRDGAELLYSKAAELACLDGSNTLVDLYCGTGTIGLSMASKAKRVFGIDIVEESIECARENARANGITNAEFAATDAGVPENIKKCLAENGILVADATVIMDPPRKGSTPELISFLAKEKVKKIVYISCNPDTLARDCKQFVELGYTMSDVLPVNMFPRTGHVESVVCLKRRLGN